MSGTTEFEKAPGLDPREPFSICEGWRGLVEEAAEEFAALPFDARIAWAKEKWGSLVLSISYDSDAPGAYGIVQNIKERFRLKSLTICEDCGRIGRLRMSRDFMKTVCEECAVRMGPDWHEYDGLLADGFQVAEFERQREASAA